MHRKCWGQLSSTWSAAILGVNTDGEGSIHTWRVLRASVSGSRLPYVLPDPDLLRPLWAVWWQLSSPTFPPESPCFCFTKGKGHLGTTATLTGVRCPERKTTLRRQIKAPLDSMKDWQLLCLSGSFPFCFNKMEGCLLELWANTWLRMIFLNTDHGMVLGIYLGRCSRKCRCHSKTPSVPIVCYLMRLGSYTHKNVIQEEK